MLRRLFFAVILISGLLHQGIIHAESIAVVPDPSHASGPVAGSGPVTANPHPINNWDRLSDFASRLLAVARSNRFFRPLPALSAEAYLKARPQGFPSLGLRIFGGRGMGYCGGTLVNRTLLTTGWRCVIALAGHCSREALQGRANGQVTVDTEFGRIQATAITHPGFVQQSARGQVGSDIGAYVFDRGCERAGNIPVWPLFEGRLNPNDQVILASQNTKQLLAARVVGGGGGGLTSLIVRGMINVADSGSGVFVRRSDGSLAYAGDISAKTTPGETPDRNSLVQSNEGIDWLRNLIARYVPTHLIQGGSSSVAAANGIMQVNVPNPPGGASGAGSIVALGNVTPGSGPVALPFSTAPNPGTARPPDISAGLARAESRPSGILSLRLQFY